jgi:glyoxylase-like metal-dependent hydrolase (beta-lactamase superfamily II)
VLVDTGIPGYTQNIIRAAQHRFGKSARPEAIVLTHGHFDHVGNVKDLARWWDVPVYAHRLELPYLDGRSDYPPPDPTVGGGLMARSAKLFPRAGIDLRPRLRVLNEDGSLPAMPGWRWVFTPGHTPGHVSLFRDEDRVLLAGDAFITTKQESLLSVMTQHKVMHGPPMYFTTDWEKSGYSVRQLAALAPSVAATGHGEPMSGPRLEHDLRNLAAHFETLAVPSDGRYVREPALADETGVLYIPPPVFDATPFIAAGVALAVIGGLAAHSARRSSRWR